MCEINGYSIWPNGPADELNKPPNLCVGGAHCCECMKKMSEITAQPEGMETIVEEFVLTNGSNEPNRELLIDLPQVKQQLFLHELPQCAAPKACTCTVGGAQSHSVPTLPWLRQQQWAPSTISITIQQNDYSTSIHWSPMCYMRAWCSSSLAVVYKDWWRSIIPSSIISAISNI